MQKLSGHGTAFIEIDGHAAEYELGAGQEMLVSTGYLAAMEESCSMDVVMVKGAKNMLLGGEGISARAFLIPLSGGPERSSCRPCLSARWLNC